MPSDVPSWGTVTHSQSVTYSLTITRSHSLTHSLTVTVSQSVSQSLTRQSQVRARSSAICRLFFHAHTRTHTHNHTATFTRPSLPPAVASPPPPLFVWSFMMPLSLSVLLLFLPAAEAVAPRQQPQTRSRTLRVDGSSAHACMHVRWKVAGPSYSAADRNRTRLEGSVAVPRTAEASRGQTASCRHRVSAWRG